jgi:hypothetical protein
MIYKFDTTNDLFDFVKACPDNINKLIKEKKASIKLADAVLFSPSNEYITKTGIKEAGLIDKAEPTLSEGQIMVRAIINTTNVLDSHDDVHIPGLWKKSLQENRYILHLQEHERKHDKVISDNLKAYTKNVSWESLGYSFAGNTQALIFDSIVSKERNEFMYDQYLKGYIKQHSVGMKYVKMYFCVNSGDEWATSYKDNWDKYIDQVVNRKEAEVEGYFFAVTEAEVVEGSSVVFGSNHITPTISVTQSKQEDNSEAANDSTSNDKTIEPSIDTQKQVNIIKNLKF